MTVDLLTCLKALRLVPDLWIATQIYQKVSSANEEKQNIYPIADVEGLIRAANGSDADCRLDGMTLTPAHAREFFPRIFFPIASGDELLAAVYAALCYGRSIHHAEHVLELHQRTSAN